MTRRKTYAGILIWIVLLAAGGYFFQGQLLSTFYESIVYLKSAADWVLITCFAAIYCLLLFLLAFAWSRLASEDVGGIPWSAISAYGMSSLFKYLPGNVFHFLGRQFLAAKIGITQKNAMKATAIELTLHVIVSSSLIAIALYFALMQSGGTNSAIWQLVTGYPLAAFFVVFSPVIAGIWYLVHQGKNKEDKQKYQVSFFFQTLFFIGNGMLAVWAITAMFPAFPVTGFSLFTAYTISWLIGFLMPGAPGGIGVREGVFIALTAGAISPDVLLASALLLRLITLFGEILFAVICIIILQRVEGQNIVKYFKKK